jgi:ABC-type phosphate transport system auxiliary subunit
VTSVTISEKGDGLAALVVERSSLTEQAQVLNNQMRALEAEFNDRFRVISLQQYQVLDQMVACDEAIAKIARTI